ncbi:hypothetical protein GCM10010912_05850 [Paenibacillus albidus]|uniref:Group-specific protein n=1 Tax=Paenibacillus albidus TaxID=2041023 RepID=A0A917BZR3_9BACL|nr:hypothetical protein [Paenibacillus albidus]GGF63609.1 hypothetical protein GCM10010912_05850 [Paenibacillus albidus]
MKLMPEYAQDIIVGVLLEQHWSWYVTEREYWFLNTEMEDRFGIEVLDEMTAAVFLEKIADHKVSARELTALLTELEGSFQSYDEVLEFIPAIYVNFDERVLYSLFPEPMSFEHYVPPGWTGEYTDFLEKVPEGERYWIVRGSSFFNQMWERFGQNF